MTRLAAARTWTAAATDATGRELYRTTITMPRAAQMAAEFRATQAKIVAANTRFLATAGRDGGGLCDENPPPGADI